MIKITELRPPIKISGLTSLGVSFSFNQDILNVVKSFSPAHYHKKINMWELPTIYLPDLLDKLTFYDDIDLTLVDPNEIQQISEFTKPLSEKELSSFKIKPFPHQVDGINYMLAHKKSLLLDAPGLGKTSQLIYYAETLKKRGAIDHCLIICGINSLKSNWRREIQKFSDEHCIIIGEKRKKNG